MTQKKIRKLGDVYLTLRFDEISEKTGIDTAQVLPFIVNMVANNQIRALINQETKTVEFIDEAQETLDLVKTLEQQNLRIV
jgi:hypothetical protein